MNGAAVKRQAREWVRANVGRWPGLRAAHLVGGITTTPDDAPWPAHKDVDLHLIFAEGSAALQPAGPFPTMIEEDWHRLLLEAGIKAETEYRSAEAVLANPKIAHHLALDCVLYDPEVCSAACRSGYDRSMPAAAGSRRGCATNGRG